MQLHGGTYHLTTLSAVHSVTGVTVCGACIVERSSSLAVLVSSSTGSVVDSLWLANTVDAATAMVVTATTMVNRMASVPTVLEQQNTGPSKLCHMQSRVVSCAIENFVMVNENSISSRSSKVVNARRALPSHWHVACCTCIQRSNIRSSVYNTIVTSCFVFVSTFIETGDISVTCQCPR